MPDLLAIMWKPFLACLVLTGIHAYFGLHVVERKVIFVDLALAQIAALGATLAVLLGRGPEDPATYWLSLAATFIGATLFALTRSRREKIPHEAVIGIVYAVSAAAVILMASRTAEGDEHIRVMLTGNILLVSGQDIAKMAVLYSLVGLVHWRFRRTFLAISTQPEEAYRKGVRVRAWDLLFYMTFGIVVTSSVEVAGVLVVFSFLIVPAVTAILLRDTFSERLGLAWLLGAATSAAGILASYAFDLPTGAAVVCAFGAMLAAVSVGKWKRGA